MVPDSEAHGDLDPGVHDRSRQGRGGPRLSSARVRGIVGLESTPGVRRALYAGPPDHRYAARMKAMAQMRYTEPAATLDASAPSRDRTSLLGFDSVPWPRKI